MKTEQQSYQVALRKLEDRLAGGDLSSKEFLEAASYQRKSVFTLDKDFLNNDDYENYEPYVDEGGNTAIEDQTRVNECIIWSMKYKTEPCWCYAASQICAFYVPKCRS